jgi:hypothetical protein
LICNRVAGVRPCLFGVHASANSLQAELEFHLFIWLGNFSID